MQRLTISVTGEFSLVSGATEWLTEIEISTERIESGKLNRKLYIWITIINIHPPRDF